MITAEYKCSTCGHVWRSPQKHQNSSMCTHCDGARSNPRIVYATAKEAMMLNEAHMALDSAMKEVNRLRCELTILKDDIAKASNPCPCTYSCRPRPEGFGFAARGGK